MFDWYLIRSALVFSLRVTWVVFCVLVGFHIVCAPYFRSDMHSIGSQARPWLLANVLVSCGSF